MTSLNRPPSTRRFFGAPDTSAASVARDRACANAGRTARCAISPSPTTANRSGVAMRLTVRQVAVRRPVDHDPEPVVSRAVAGTIPGALGSVPPDQAAEVDADGGEPVQRAIRLAV